MEMTKGTSAGRLARLLRGEPLELVAQRGWEASLKACCCRDRKIPGSDP